MVTCRWINQIGQRCGMPHGHALEHGNGLLTQGQQTWTESPCPVFFIKATDPFACAIIRIWLTLASSYKGRDGIPAVNQKKLDSAWTRFYEFEQYQQDYGTKIPD